MANKARGFVRFDFAGKSHDLCLGLGVLAEIEDTMGVASFEDALDFGERVSASKMLAFTKAVLIGNGVSISTEEEQRALRAVSVEDFLRLLHDLTGAAGMKPENEAPAATGEKAERPLGAKSGGKRG